MKSSPQQELATLRALSALAQPLRLRAFRALVAAGDEGMTPSVLAAKLEVAPSALSFHLKELSHADLVRAEPLGRHIVYRAHFDSMTRVLGYLTEHCCGGRVCAPSDLVARRRC